VQEAILAEEQAHSLHFFRGCDLLAELEGLCVCMDRAEVEHATEAGQLSRLVTEISNALVDLGMLPIREIP
jgi:hypothetical protein